MEELPKCGGRNTLITRAIRKPPLSSLVCGRRARRRRLHDGGIFFVSGEELISRSEERSHPRVDTSHLGPGSWVHGKLVVRPGRWFSVRKVLRPPCS